MGGQALLIGIVALAVLLVGGGILLILKSGGSKKESHDEDSKREDQHAASKSSSSDEQSSPLLKKADDSLDLVFNDEFREELRNRGRLHFEKIISENAMFLQQDLRLTTSQLNDFMKDEIRRVLKEEFAAYEQSIATAKDQALESIKKTQDAIEQQRDLLEGKLKEEIESEKQRIVGRIENNLSEIISHYLIDALGDEVSFDSQLEYILGQLEENKNDIIEDVRHAA